MVQEHPFDAKEVDAETVLLMVLGVEVVHGELIGVLGHLKQPRLGALFMCQYYHLVALSLVKVGNDNFKTRPHNDLKCYMMIESHCEDSILGLIIPVSLPVEPDAVFRHLDDGRGVEPWVDV